MLSINEVARGPVPVSKLEGLECRLDHVIGGERVKMKATVSRLQCQSGFLGPELTPSPCSVTRRRLGVELGYRYLVV